VEGVDAALVGPADLSLSMGIVGQFDHPRFVAALNKVIDSCNAHGVTPGMLGTDDVGKRARMGFRMFCRMNDLGFIGAEAKLSLEESRKAVASIR
jgi:4-hydroxy-2-oxoheptanedioate aldolase